LLAQPLAHRRQRHYAGFMTFGLRLVLFTRYPAPGKAKTRLIPALGAEGAAALHRRLAERALGTLQHCGLPVEVRTTGAPVDAFERWLGPRHFIDQGDGDLGARLSAVFNDGPALIVGSDVPAMTAAHVMAAAVLLAGHDIVLGPASDGGYWLIGLKGPAPALFADMPWGTAAVFAETQARAQRLGLDLGLADTLDDLDTPDDLARWPELLA
jgi:rSAM/selenodomain-associated transferase 1